MIETYNLLNVTPGEIATLNLPSQGESGTTYSIIEAVYDLDPTRTYNDNVLTVRLNKRLTDFADIMKDQILRLRNLEAANIETAITNLKTSAGSIAVSGIGSLIERSIGSAFYFHIDGHNVLNSPSSLLGDARGGSTVLTF